MNEKLLKTKTATSLNERFIKDQVFALNEYVDLFLLLVYDGQELTCNLFLLILLFAYFLLFLF